MPLGTFNSNVKIYLFNVFWGTTERLVIVLYKYYSHTVYHIFIFLNLLCNTGQEIIPQKSFFDHSDHITEGE